jgi:hypothetical protein
MAHDCAVAPLALCYTHSHQNDGNEENIRKKQYLIKTLATAHNTAKKKKKYFSFFSRSHRPDGKKSFSFGVALA